MVAPAAVTAPVQSRARHPEQDEHHPRRDQHGPHLLLDVPEVEVAEEAGVQEADAAEDEQEDLKVPFHSRNPPISTLHSTATTIVAAEKRTANGRPKVPA
ncbi:hypothetical protein GCM10010508_09440 [Streptomyces naganishii JCM 4654]|uniref:Uncharacterized protein n=1 Tax=Streptomyces naganishii JCM 4654 TaxID=1306179 RepID=A0A919CTI7_9ACTN|nr:hypothetical protein GCM10010508_09440 [Streptomyces naganishii JCM 4654]